MVSEMWVANYIKTNTCALKWTHTIIETLTLLRVLPQIWLITIIVKLKKVIKERKYIQKK